MSLWGVQSQMFGHGNGDSLAGKKVGVGVGAGTGNQSGVVTRVCVQNHSRRRRQNTSTHLHNGVKGSLHGAGGWEGLGGWPGVASQVPTGSHR